MTALEIVARYYDAWQTKQGEMTDVPLAEDFAFTGPVASFDDAEGFRAMAREAGPGGDELQRAPPVRRRRHGLLDHRLGDGDPGHRAHDLGRAAARSREARSCAGS